jgi:hypothetical protein
MKNLLKISFLMSLTILVFSCQNNSDKKLSPDLINISKSAENPSDKAPAITFEKTEFNFGKILQGEVVSYTFHFTNNGNAPLIITSVDKSCGCTAGDFPRQPIAPGEGGDIKITYDSKGHFGFQSKTVTVNSNAMPSQTTLRIKAEVRTPDQL